MRKAIACTLVALSILLVFSANSAPTLAADYTKPGAVVGTNALYDYALKQTGMNINAIRIRVTSVSGSELTLEKTEYNPGGSVNNTHTGTYDVNTYQYAPWLFVAANISAGEAPYPSSGSWKFNSTVLNYHIAGRYWTANYINGTIMGINFAAYIDKPTGIVLLSRYRDSFGLTQNYTMTSYTIEPGLPITIILIAGGAAAVLIVLAAVLLHMRRK